MTASRKRDLEAVRKRLRKRSVNTFRIPIELIFPPTFQSSRSVYIVARPLTKAGYFKFLSDGKLLLCHWGLPVSPYNQMDLRQHIISQSESGSNGASDSWGTLYEITNGDGAMVLNVNEYFGRHFGHDWRYALIAEVGTAQIPDKKIYDHGKIPISNVLTRGSM